MNDQSASKIAANPVIPVSELRRWFCDALRETDPVPSLDACERLARHIQVVINRQNNAQLQRHGPVPLMRLKDVSPADETEKRIGKFMAALDQVAVEVNELEDYVGGGYRLGHDGDLSVEDVQILLSRIRACPVPQTSPAPPARGRPREIWHSAARKIGPLISAVMQDAGYGGRLRMNDEESVTAAVGAAVISRAYGINITRSGFATAMRQRDRRKKRNGTLPALSQ